MKVKKKRYFLLLISLLFGMILLVGGCSGTATAKSGDKVKVDYTLKLSDGTIFDTSVGKTPLEFTLGQNQVVVGFEKAVTGMKVGESKTVTIPPDEGYGQRDESLVVTVDKTQLPTDLVPTVGQQLQATNTNGSTSVFTITQVNDTTVILDGNSPLAGKDLTFEIKLLQIEK